MFFHKMRKQMKAIVIVVVVAMAGGLLWVGGVSLFGGKQNTQPAQAAVPVAVVNGRAISYYDWYHTFINRLQQLEQEQRTLPGSSYEAVKFQALESLIGSVIITQELEERNTTASKAEIDRKYQDIVEQFPSVDDFKVQLEWAGLTEDMLRKSLEQEIKFEKLQDDIIGELPVSEWELQEAYERVQASHILITPESADEEDWFGAEEKAWQILSELTVNNFADFAQIHSGDSSKDRGGDIGYISRGQTVPEFEEIAFALAINEISEPVRSQYGYHIITVTERKDAEGEDFERERPELERRIRQEKGQKDVAAWFEEKREAAEVQYTNHQMNAYNQMLLGNFEDAVHYYKLAIEEEPNDGYLYASLGDAYEELGEHEEAIVQYQSAIDIFDSDFSLYMGLGHLYEQAERIDEAVEVYLKASELVPYDIFTQLNLYSQLNRLERYDDALIIEERITAYQDLQNEMLREQGAILEEFEETGEQPEAEEVGGVVPELPEEPLEASATEN